MKIFKEIELLEMSNVVKNNGIIAFPTETVFGLGVIFDNKEAYDKLVKVKRRPPEKPFTMMLADPEDVEKYCYLDEIGKEIVRTFMPGQFTLITRAKPGLPSWCIGNTGLVGVRIPDYENIRELIRKIGKPMLVPSANKSGESPANSVEEVIESFEGELDGVLEGASKSKMPSSILLIDGENIQLIREGIVSINQINEVINKIKGAKK